MRAYIVILLVAFIQNVFSSSVNNKMAPKSIFQINRNWIEISDDIKVLPIHDLITVYNQTKELIFNAQKSIFVNVYNNKIDLKRDYSKFSERTYDEKDIWDILIQKSNEGIPVKVIVGKTNIKKAEKDKINQIASMNKNFDVIFYSHSKTGRYAEDKRPDDHSKVVLVDDNKAYVGTCNLRNDYTNRSSSLIIESKRELKDLKGVLYEKWHQQNFTPQEQKEISEFDNVLFLRNNSVDKNIKYNALLEIQRAKKRIYLSQMVLTDKDIINSLIQKKKNHPEVEIKIILSRLKLDLSPLPILNKIFINNNIADYEKLKQNGIDVRWYNTKDKSVADVDHRKLLIADDTVITGSADYYSRAFYSNQELAVKLKSKELAAEYARFFEVDADWANEDVSPFSKMETLLSKMLNKYQEKVRGLKIKWRKLVGNRVAYLLNNKTRKKLFRFFMNKKIRSIMVKFEKMRMEQMRSGKKFHETVEGDVKYFYRGVPANEYHIFKNSKHPNLSLNFEPSVGAHGLYVTENIDKANEFALLKSDINLNSYLLKLKLRKGSIDQLMKFDENEESLFESWSLRNFGTINNDMLPVYVMLKGKKGYYWGEYEDATTFVFFDETMLINAEKENNATLYNLFDVYDRVQQKENFIYTPLALKNKNDVNKFLANQINISKARVVFFDINMLTDNKKMMINIGQMANQLRKSGYNVVEIPVGKQMMGPSAKYCNSINSLLNVKDDNTIVMIFGSNIFLKNLNKIPVDLLFTQNPNLNSLKNKNIQIYYDNSNSKKIDFYRISLNSNKKLFKSGFALNFNKSS